MASDASPQPHTLGPITLSNTNASVVFPAAFFQLGVDAGLFGDGLTIPSTVTLVMKGSNTVEATHTYSKSTTSTLHVVGGIAQPLTTAVQLPNTLWHPTSSGAPVVFTENSAKAVLTLDLQSTLGAILTQTSVCAPLTAAAILTINGTSTTTTELPQPSYLAACSGKSGTIDSVLTDNGVGGSGLLYATKSPQQFRASASGQTCSGGIVSAARTKMTVRTTTPVNCQTLPQTTTQPGVPLGGAGTFTWTAPAGMGTSNFSVRWTWISNTKIHFAGSITGGASVLFGGRHVSGNLTTLQSLAPVASGGNCRATIPLMHFDITAIGYRITRWLDLRGG